MLVPGQRVPLSPSTVLTVVRVVPPPVFNVPPHFSPSGPPSSMGVAGSPYSASGTGYQPPYAYPRAEGGMEHPVRHAHGSSPGMDYDTESRSSLSGVRDLYNGAGLDTPRADVVSEVAETKGSGVSLPMSLAGVPPFQPRGAGAFTINTHMVPVPLARFLHEVRRPPEDEFAPEPESTPSLGMTPNHSPMAPTRTLALPDSRGNSPRSVASSYHPSDLMDPSSPMQGDFRPHDDEDPTAGEHRIYLNGIPPQITEADVRAHFAQFGHVRDVYFPVFHAVVARDGGGGLSSVPTKKRRGFCFVTMGTASDLDRVMALSDRVVGGYLIPEMRKARPRAGPPPARGPAPPTAGHVPEHVVRAPSPVPYDNGLLGSRRPSLTRISTSMLPGGLVTTSAQLLGLGLEATMDPPASTPLLRTSSGASRDPEESGMATAQASLAALHLDDV
jgi:hypothetical protein